MKFNLLFVGTILVALIGAFMTEVAQQEWFVWVTVLVGVVVGLVNIASDETVKFGISYLLVAASTGALAALPLLGELTPLFTSIAAVFLPAALVTGLVGLIKTGGNK